MKKILLLFMILSFPAWCSKEGKINNTKNDFVSVDELKVAKQIWDANNPGNKPTAAHLFAIVEKMKENKNDPKS